MLFYVLLMVCLQQLCRLRQAIRSSITETDVEISVTKPLDIAAAYHASKYSHIILYKFPSIEPL